LCTNTVFRDGTPTGYFCQVLESSKTFDGRPGGQCTTLQPYTKARMVKSIDGTVGVVCTLATSTCQAVADANGKRCTDSSSCGVPSLDDAQCVTVPQSTVMVCAQNCITDDDCIEANNYGCIQSPKAGQSAACGSKQ